MGIIDGTNMYDDNHPVGLCCKDIGKECMREIEALGDNLLFKMTSLSPPCYEREFIKR